MKHLKTLLKEALGLTADIQNYNDRIEAGKKKEAQIIRQLRKQGVKIEDPTPQEDMYDKIDGWMTDSKGVKLSVQIKFRESGDDIIFEIMKDLDKDKPGRDLISKADLYLVVDRKGKGRLLKTSQIKGFAKKLADAIQEAIVKAPDRRKWEGKGWEVKITYDRASGNKKLMGFFAPTMFPSIASWRFNLNESELEEEGAAGGAAGGTTSSTGTADGASDGVSDGGETGEAATRETDSEAITGGFSVLPNRLYKKGKCPPGFKKSGSLCKQTVKESMWRVFTEKDEIPGGKADGKTAEDIAEKWDVSIEYIKKQIEKGIKVEYEHTNDRSKSKEITLDHLWFDGADYYERLEAMEKDMEKHWKDK